MPIWVPTRRLALFSAIVLVTLASSPIFAATAQEPPDVVIGRVSQQLVLSIGKAPANTQDGQRRIQGLVEQDILPYVDFQRATSVLAGRYWRDATPDQQKQLTGQFRSMVVFAITAALDREPYDRVEVEPAHGDAAAEFAEVNARVFRRTGPPIPLSYRMEKTASGWKIDDVSVSGSWLAQSYRPLFSTEINRGGIDGLIMTLTKRNRQQAELP